MVQTALRVMEGYNKWDIEAILAPRDVLCTQVVLPMALNRLPQTNDEYRQGFSSIMHLFTGFHVTIHEIVEDPKRNSVLIHASSKATTPLGPYANEYMIVFNLTDDHERVLHIKEFVDSSVSVNVMSKLREYAAAQKKT